MFEMETSDRMRQGRFMVAVKDTEMIGVTVEEAEDREPKEGEEEPCSFLIHSIFLVLY